MWHKPFSDRGETLWSETTQMAKFGAVDRLSIPRLLIFLCLTLSGGFTASTFTSWHYDMTEWFLGGEKLSLESQWKLTSMPVLFFFFFALSCNGFLMKPKANLLNLNNCPLECYCQDSYSIFLILLFPQVTFAGYGVFPGLSADIKHTIQRI